MCGRVAARVLLLYSVCMAIFFTSDQHFGDDRIRRYENRPFESVQAMDESLVSAWNNTVAADDRVFVLGDFALYDEEHIAGLCARLNGTKYLIKGNHDVLANDVYRRCGFAEVYDYPILFEQFWLLSHEPLYINSNMPYANIFGHVHGSPAYVTASRQSFCVCVERTGYAPVPFDAVRNAVGAAC